MYNYKDGKSQLFTEDGQVVFLKVRDTAQRLLKESGAIRMLEVIRCVSGASDWMKMCCVDRLVEIGELRELSYGTQEVAGQHRVFVSNK
jgi:hypothetical protein